MIAASATLAVGGSLAVAASASAAAIPWGTATDAGSTSVYGLYNQASTGLVNAQNLIVLTNGIEVGAWRFLMVGLAVTPPALILALATLFAIAR